MQFIEFAQELSQVIRAGANTCMFTKLLKMDMIYLMTMQRVLIKVILMEKMKLVVFLRK